MRKIILRLLPLMLVLAMAGCALQGSRQAADSAGIEGPCVYYVSDISQGLVSAPCEISSRGEDAIRDVFHTLRLGEFTDGHPAVPEAVVLEHTAWQADSLVVYLEGEYPEIGTQEEAFCRAALVLSLLSVSDVDSVIIHVNGIPLTDRYGRESGSLSRRDFLMDLQEKHVESRAVTLTLYFGAEGGSRLAAESVGTEIRADRQPEAVALEMLLKGPLNKSHIATIPAGTEILGVSLRDRICYVNVSEALRNGETLVPDRLMIYSIVNTLCALQNVDKVQITVNGVADISFSDGLTINAPLEADFSLVEESAGEP